MYSNKDDIPTNGVVPNESSFTAETKNDSFQETKFQHFVRAKGVYVAMAWTMMGLFAGIPILIWFTSFTIISVGSILLLLFVFGAVGLFQWKYFKNHIDMEYRHYAMFAFTGFAIFMINVILFLNYSVRIAEHTETYTIIGVTNYNHKTEIAIDEIDSNVEGKINNFLNERNKEVPRQAKKITIVFEKGLFGFEMIGDCKFN